ncbi:unnamed protein product [Ranitomeya imitator]|uniref:Maturase K n=1 Tax=Ranitomeya imitator TaxID=111125 RepID=A0ABN9KPH5_9NEOB|nr:unnamed protein product [Ranitomeya imitator]
MDPVKVQAIHDWIQPTSVKGLQKFLEFANFYRRFSANFSSVDKPLTDLTKKGTDRVLQEFQADRPDRCPVGKLFVPDRWTSKVEPSDCPGVDSVVDRLQQIWTHVVDNLMLSQERAQRFANRRRSLLRRYVVPVVSSVDPLAPVLVEGELEYEVEKILDSRFFEAEASVSCQVEGLCLWTYPFSASMFVQRYLYELILSCWKLWEADLPSTPLVRETEVSTGGLSFGGMYELCARSPNPLNSSKRSCAGENLAKMELYLFFTRLLQNFTFKAPPGATLDLTPAVGFIASPMPYKMCAIPRV